MIIWLFAGLYLNMVIPILISIFLSIVTRPPLPLLLRSKRRGGKDLLKREQYYIDLMNPEYNILKKAGSLLGFKHREETIAKMSISKAGEKNHMFGKLGVKHPMFGKTGEKTLCSENQDQKGLDLLLNKSR
jgi:NUMOD3 motif